MITAIIVVSAVLIALFVVVAVAGNRAQTRMIADAEQARRAAAARNGVTPDA